MGNFLRNVVSFYRPTFLKLILDFVSTAIYIRVIGTMGFAIIGIVLSLFQVLSIFDITYFLGLVKYNSDALKKKKRLFEQTFNTIYTSIIIRNLLFIFISLPIIIFLSKYYNIQGLLLYYTIALINSILNRNSNFFKSFLRANGSERVIEHSRLVSMTVQFLISMILLLILHFGVLSIFIGDSFKELIEYFWLYGFINKKRVKIKPRFSKKIWVRIFKKYALTESYLQILFILISRGGLFISTFFFDKNSIGILTIFFSIYTIISIFFSSLSIHIPKIYSKEIYAKNKKKIQSVINNMTSTIFLLNLIVISFLSTIGKPIFLLYFGKGIGNNYIAFLFLIFSLLLKMQIRPALQYFFVYDVTYYLKIQSILSVFFLSIIVPFMLLLGILGIGLGYFLSYTFFLITGLYYFKKKYKSIFNKEIWLPPLCNIIFMFLGIGIQYFGTMFTLSKSFLLFVILIAIIIKVNYKKVITSIKFLHDL